MGKNLLQCGKKIMEFKEYYFTCKDRNTTCKDCNIPRIKYGMLGRAVFVLRCKCGNNQELILLSGGETDIER